MSTAPTLPPLSDDALREIESGWYPTRLDMLRAVRDAATAHASALAQRVEELTTARDVAVELGATYAARADDLAREAMTWRNRHDEMRALLDSRPAINAGLVAAYITWNGQCYQLDWLNARDAARKGASL
jgi:hypothetical protein